MQPTPLDYARYFGELDIVDAELIGEHGLAFLVGAGERFLDALQLFTRLVNIGDAKSLATHPASTTHRQLSPAELEKTGVGLDTVRLCIGIEHIDDLIADLEQALAAV